MDWHRNRVGVKFRVSRVEVPECFVKTLQYMLRELQDNQLKTELVNAPDPKYPGHKIRKVVSRNAKWYRDYCSQFHSNSDAARQAQFNGRIKTKISRVATIRVMQVMIKRGYSHSPYAETLIEIARKMDDEIWKHQG